MGVAIAGIFEHLPRVFRGLLLDLDDTLYDRGAAFAAWVAERLGHEPTPGELGELRAIDGRGHRPRPAFAADAAKLGIAVDPDRFPFELAEHVRPEPGVADAIIALAATRRVAVVTNGGSAQRSKLARIGLDRVVQATFVSGELGMAKPDPALFARALAWTELAASEVLFVGDEPAIDLAPAAALGMATAWRRRVPWPEGLALAAPTFTIQRVVDLLELCG
jgi:putative hydrolase of the HAD superfamily